MSSDPPPIILHGDCKSQNLKGVLVRKSTRWHHCVDGIGFSLSRALVSMRSDTQILIFRTRFVMRSRGMMLAGGFLTQMRWAGLTFRAWRLVYVVPSHLLIPETLFLRRRHCLLLLLFFVPFYFTPFSIFLGENMSHSTVPHASTTFVTSMTCGVCWIRLLLLFLA